MLDKFRETAITWDKATRRIYSPITANASDSNGRKLNIQVVNSGQVENLTGAALHLYWETKDKAQHGLDAFTASDISKGEFEIFYTTGMLSNVGELNATLVLVDSTGKVVSDWFKITVTRGINEGAIESENSFSSLTQALIDVSNLEQNYAPRLNDLTAQLQQKVGSGIKAELEDLSATVIGAIDGTGGPFNLLSIPQDVSVTPEKFDADTKGLIGLLKENKYDGTVIQGMYASDGTLFNITNPDCKCTPKMRINPYITTLVHNWIALAVPARATATFIFWQSDGTFLATSSSTTSTMSVPAGAHYVGLNLAVPSSVSAGGYFSVDPAQFRLYQQNYLVDEPNQWRGKTWVAYGTSLTSVVQGKFANIVAEKSGLILTNNGIAGGKFKDTIRDAVLTAPADVDLITLEGAPNDWWYDIPLGTLGDTDTTTFYGNLYVMLEYLTKHTNARIVTITTTGSRTFGAITSGWFHKNALGLYNQDYAEAIKKISVFYGIPCIKVDEEAGINEGTADLYLSDQIHYNDLGGLLVGEYVWSKLKDISPLS